MGYRVVQWATGHVGTAQLQELIDHPDLDLVGVLVYGSDKVGVDAGRLCDRPDTGVLATDDKGAIVALDADVVLHAASKVNKVNTNTDDIVNLLASGKNVITTTTYNHLPTYGGDAEARFAAACEAGRSTFFAAGENPGFMMQRLAATVSGLCKRIDHIAVEEYFDCDWMLGREMLFDGMLMGAAPEAVTLDAPIFRVNSIQYQQEIAATAAVLGIELDRIEPAIEVATLDRDLHIAIGTIPAGTVIGQRMSWTGYWRDRPFLTIRELWVLTRDIPQWGLDQLANWIEDSHIRVVIDGLPSFTLDLGITLPAGTKDTDEGNPMHVMIAMTGARAIPEVMAASPGILQASVFAPYRPH